MQESLANGIEDDGCFEFARTAGRAMLLDSALRGAPKAKAKAKARGSASSTAGTNETSRASNAIALASKIRTKTLKDVTAVKSLVAKAVDVAERTLKQALHDLGEDFAEDPHIKEIQHRLDLVNMMNDYSKSTVGNADLKEKLWGLASKDAYLKEAVAPDLLSTVACMEHIRNVEAPVQRSVEAVHMLMDRSQAQYAAFKTCAQALLLGLELPGLFYVHHLYHRLRFFVTW